VLLTTILFSGVATFALKLPFALAAALCVPLLFVDGAVVSANVAKYFVSGPVLLSYPANDEQILQSQAKVGTMGPVPGDGAFCSVLMFALL
jgi:hypothetical protein